MSSLLQKWSAFPRWFKRTATFVGVLSGIATIYTAAEIFFAAPLRPAWAWEIQTVTQLHEDLSRKQLETQISLERINRRDFRRTLNEYRAMREQYIQEGRPVPGWLTREISDAKEDVDRAQERINRLQQEIILKMEETRNSS